MVVEIWSGSDTDHGKDPVVILMMPLFIGHCYLIIIRPLRLAID
jgi:hypothetical protein